MFQGKDPYIYFFYRPYWMDSLNVQHTQVCRQCKDPQNNLECIDMLQLISVCCTLHLIHMVKDYRDQLFQFWEALK